MVRGDGSHTRELDQTPTWAVAAVCAVIVLVSIILEKVLHHVGEYFQERKKKALYEALEKVKGELMVLGFISLILTFGQNYVARICIPDEYANTMLPCVLRLHYEEEIPGEPVGHEPVGHEPVGHEPTGHEPAGYEPPPSEHHRRLLWSQRRFLSGGGDAPKCPDGFEPLISLNGLHQLHIFIFFLAVFHVIYSAITMMLGRLKIRGWKEWENEAAEQDFDMANNASRFRLTHETSFVKAHTSFWTKIPIFFFFGCFFRQFFRSVRRSDYLTMRHGFITVHLAPGSKFNFQKYIKRSLEDDFKVVVGISPLLWASVVFVLLINVNGWQSMFCISLVPLIIILAVGTKLQAIITQMAVEITERHAVVQGIPLVQVSDSHFWFGWPKLILYLIHFILFQNAFQITYFLWTWYEFGINSCFHQNSVLSFIRVSMGILVQFMCSYITLPLYALVTQMGSSMKRSIFDEHTSKALKNWRMKAKKPDGIPGPGVKTLGGSPTSVDSSENPPFQVKTDVEANGRAASEPATVIANLDQGGTESRTREEVSRRGDQQLRNRSNMDLLSGP